MVPSRAPVVLIVDDDLGFVWWLGDIFSKAGCQVVPALNIEQSVSITKELNLEVDVIVVNPELAGISEIIRALSCARPLKIVAIGNHDADVKGTVHAQATLERPSGWDSISQQAWLGCVRRVVKEVHATSFECPECS